MSARCLEDALGERVRVAVLDVHHQTIRVELACEQKLVDDIREPARLFDDDLEEPLVHRGLEVEVRRASVSAEP